MSEARETTGEAKAVAHNDMANAIRALAMDAVQAAKSGHPGMPMGMADVATVLFREAMRFDAADPNWPNRDRFVLSAGHGSMLLYALLYLTGYPGMEVGELKRFRQLGAKTAGHPEHGHAAGIETTTGPLGQGLGQCRRHGAVGAPVERAARRRCHRPPHLRHRRRRLPHGRHQPRGDLARRTPRARQAHRAVRRQRHLHRRPHQPVGDRRPGRALQGFGVERGGHRRARSGCHLGGAGQGARRCIQAVADRLQDDHRLRRADQGRQVLDARRAAGRGRDQGHAREAALAACAVRNPRAGVARLAGRRPARRQGARKLEVARRQGGSRHRCSARRAGGDQRARRRSTRPSPRPSRRRWAIRPSAPPACGRNWRWIIWCRCCPS